LTTGGQVSGASGRDRVSSVLREKRQRAEAKAVSRPNGRLEGLAQNEDWMEKAHPSNSSGTKVEPAHLKALRVENGHALRGLEEGVKGAAVDVSFTSASGFRGRYGVRREGCEDRDARLGQRIGALYDPKRGVFAAPTSAKAARTCRSAPRKAEAAP